ncbi:MAG: hypothetical protein U0599_03865 [Vicinamibacteria bacterium]
MTIVANAPRLGGGLECSGPTSRTGCSTRCPSRTWASAPAWARSCRGSCAARTCATRGQRRAGRRLVYRFAEPPAYETDGEWNQAKSNEIVIEAVPKALRVLAPAP